MGLIKEEKCMDAMDTNLVFQKTFEFIQENQVLDNGYLSETTIELKFSLTNSQSPLSTTVRESATNTVKGFINIVGKTNVVVIAKSTCADRYDVYTIEYSQIIEVISDVIIRNFNDYLKSLEKTPRVCYECENQYTDMLLNYKKLIKRYKNDDTQLVKVIFDGVNSRNTRVVDLTVVRNLIVIENAFVFPITVIGGYIIVPSCDVEETKVKAGGSDDV